jgi:hypothetical protein
MPSSYLGILSQDDSARVMRHPAQERNVAVIETLIGHLRSCRTFEQYDNFQRELFQLLHSRELHKSECRQCAARLAKGKALPSTLPQLPGGADPNDPETWRIEDLVLDRICRQLRAVGDALAWRASQYDRRYIIALSSNNSPGPMAGKTGLPHELGRSSDLRSRGSFGLLHDLTNCLRIGDITEFRSDGSKWLYEIKSNPKAKKGPQRRRMEAAVEAVMNGGELPGRPGNRIVTPSVRCRTHIRTFVSGIDSSMQKGIAGTAIANARVLTAFSLPTLARQEAARLTQQSLADFNIERQQALEKAEITGVLHYVQVASVTRNHDFLPSVMPFALFPLPPIQAALLICDYLVFDVTFAPERLVTKFQRIGITADIPLALANDGLKSGDTVVRLTRGTRSISLHPGALLELLIECFDLDTWTAAIAEVFDDPNAPPHPVLAFSTTRVWS